MNLTAVWRGVISRMIGQRAIIARFGWSLLPTLGALVVQLVTFVITARGLGPVQFGQYNVILALAGIAVELTGLGGADVLVRAVARKAEAFARYFGNMLWLIVASVVPVTLACLVYILNFDAIAVAGSVIACGLFSEIIMARISASCELILVAHKHTIAAGWFRLGGMGARCLAALVFFYGAGGEHLFSWVWMISAQSLITCCIMLGLITSWYGRPVWSLIKAEFKSGLGFCLTQSSRAAQSNLDRVVLSHFADAATLGVYSATSRMMQLGLFPIQVATRMTYPQFFAEGAAGLASVRRFALRVAPVFFAIGLVAGVMVAVATWLLPLVLGSAFGGTARIGLFLAFTLPLIALQYPAADALTGGGRQSVRAVIQIIATIGFGFIMAFGAALYGQTGLVAAMIACQLLLAAALWGSLFVAAGGGPNATPSVE